MRSLCVAKLFNFAHENSKITHIFVFKKELLWGGGRDGEDDP